MTTRFGKLFGRPLLVSLAAMLLLADAAWAQRDQLPTAFLGGFLIIFLLFFLAGYVYFALAIQTIAIKTNTDNAWLAWIPIVNMYLMVMIARKPIWWFLLLFVPVVNIVFLVLIWMAVAEARGKPNWWGILIIVPVANLIVPGYLAWAD